MPFRRRAGDLLRIRALGQRVRSSVPCCPSAGMGAAHSELSTVTERSIYTNLNAEEPIADPPSYRRRSDHFLQRESVHTFVVRYPWDCSDAKFAEQWASASAQLMAYDKPFALLHDLSACDINTLSVSTVLSDASAIAARGFVRRVAFVIKTNLLTGPFADWLLGFSPVRPSLRFEEYETALQWCDELGGTGKAQQPRSHSNLLRLLSPMAMLCTDGRSAKGAYAASRAAKSAANRRAAWV